MKKMNDCRTFNVGTPNVRGDSAPGPFDNFFAQGGWPNFDRASLFERLHEVINILFIVRFHNQDEGMLAVQNGVPLQIDTEFSGILRADVFQQHRSGSRISCRAGFGGVFVLYKVKRHCVPPKAEF